MVHSLAEMHRMYVAGRAAGKSFSDGITHLEPYEAMYEIALMNLHMQCEIAMLKIDEILGLSSWLGLRPVRV